MLRPQTRTGDLQPVLKFMARKKFRFLRILADSIKLSTEIENSAPFRPPSIVVASATVPGGLENDFDFDFDARGEETE